VADLTPLDVADGVRHEQCDRWNKWTLVKPNRAIAKTRLRNTKSTLLRYTDMLIKPTA